MSKRRNSIVRFAAILRKGGVHEKAASGKRQRVKNQLQDELLDWEEEYRRDNSEARKGRKSSPPDSALANQINSGLFA